MPKQLTKIRDACPDGDTCPAVVTTDADTVVVVGQRVTDPSDLAQLAIGEDEAAVEVPASLVPEFAVHTDPAALSAFLDAHASRGMLRVETLDYDVSSDGGDFQRYMHGEPGPDQARKAARHRTLQARMDRGIQTRRVRVIHNPPTAYEIYACEWGYAHNLAYEDIRIIDLTGDPQAAVLADAGDFWLLDRGAAAVMHYDDAGCYAGFTEASPTQVALYAIAADAAWLAGVPFTQWWETHLEYRRGSRHAA